MSRTKARKAKTRNGMSQMKNGDVRCLIGPFLLRSGAAGLRMAKQFILAPMSIVMTRRRMQNSGGHFGSLKRLKILHDGLKLPIHWTKRSQKLYVQRRSISWRVIPQS